MRQVRIVFCSWSLRLPYDCLRYITIRIPACRLGLFGIGALGRLVVWFLSTRWTLLLPRASVLCFMQYFKNFVEQGVVLVFSFPLSW